MGAASQRRDRWRSSWFVPRGLLCLIVPRQLFDHVGSAREVIAAFRPRRIGVCSNDPPTSVRPAKGEAQPASYNVAFGRMRLYFNVMRQTGATTLRLVAV